jgi:hypothetical protein
MEILGSKMYLFLFDMGLPMIIPSMLMMVLALVPIIFVESFVIAARLKLELLKTLNWVALANLASTFIGIPVTWFGLAALQFATGSGNFFRIDTFWGKLIAVTWQAPWALPYGSDYDWIISAAMISLLIPFCFASWFVEYHVARTKLSTLLYEKTTDGGSENGPMIQIMEREALFPQISRAFRDANLVSYGLLVVLLLVVLFASLTRTH